MRFILIAAGIVCLLFSCKTSLHYITYSGFTQGTTWQVKFEGAPEISQQDIENILQEVDSNFSIYNKQSLISKINNNEPYVTNPRFDSLFRLSERVWEMTGGFFDITVGPLVKFWGFGPPGTEAKDSTGVDSLLMICGMNKLKLENRQVIKSHPKMYLDMNAIAQGYTVDMVADFLEGKNIVNYLVEIGGEVSAKGVNAKGKPWQVGIDSPVAGSDESNRELQEIVSVSGYSLATSGSYRKFILKDGVMFSHTIDPHTGYPSHHNLLSVTITAESCAEADAIATSVMAMGMEKGKDFLKNNPGYDAYFIFSDSAGNYAVWMTEGFGKLISSVE
jgi:thiamine biosynthesis lipoprotein